MSSSHTDQIYTGGTQMDNTDNGDFYHIMYKIKASPA